MESLRTRVETWIREQRDRLPLAWPPPTPPSLWHWRLPWSRGADRREQERALREELERRRRQLQELRRAVKAESVSDLQDVLCSMVLSECVYKRPAEEMIRFINKFKADFGGQVVSLERVQPSLDHVPHRYLLAEAGDTLYASFIGTKQYKDLMADANILQGAIFHDDVETDANGVINNDSEINIEERPGKTLQTKTSKKIRSKPAAHRGFLARAKGIPALELYKLAQKRNRKLVLCGHSLGGAVAALATLAILRVIASSSSKEHGKVPVKCITFSQPPVGNAALRDYVHQKGWEDFFKTYCIPEDLVPRILSPAYFHHYSAQPFQSTTGVEHNTPSVELEEKEKKTKLTKPKEGNREQLVLGLGPVQTSFWRLSKLVPVAGVKKQLERFWGWKNEPGESPSSFDSAVALRADDIESAPQSLEIQETSDGISLNPLPAAYAELRGGDKGISEKGFSGGADTRKWQGVPYLPSYVPFGHLYLLEDSSVKLLSEAEYSKMTSVQSVISELRERFQSHSMKSYRARFQKIYDLIMCVPTSPFLGVDQATPFPHLQQWLDFTAAGAVELGHIVEAPVIETATSILPLGWNGLSSDKKAEPFKVDILGYGLPLCTLIQAQINGSWCSTSVELLPSATQFNPKNEMQPDLQKMRVLVGPALKQPPRHAFVVDSLSPVFPSQCTMPSQECGERSFREAKCMPDNGLDNFVIFCTSDFTTVSKEVYVRTRRVCLLGLEGAGKTSLLTAIRDQGKGTNKVSLEILHPHVDHGVVGGLCYADSNGVNLQDLRLEASQFREELHRRLHDLNGKTDLVVLVHNLSHKIPRDHQSDSSPSPPALSLFLDVAKAHGIPWVLAITNKYSVSAHQQKMLVQSAMDAYRAHPGMTEVINSCPYVVPTPRSFPDTPSLTENGNLGRVMASQSLILSPINFIRIPFQKKVAVMPAHGVDALWKLVHRVLREHEEASFQELSRERLSQEMAKKQAATINFRPDPPGKGGSAAAAAVGASIGAGVGIVLALVMGAASALRKP